MKRPKYRIIYAANARGRYIAHERLEQLSPNTRCWSEVMRTYEDEMVTDYPVWLQCGEEESRHAPN